MKIGIIGQGLVGSTYSDYFEKRGWSVVRYDLGPYRSNKSQIKGCALVIIAVPTPTTPSGICIAAVEDSLSLASSEAIVVIKSTVPPGTTKALSKSHPDLTLFHSPEFLSRDTASSDIENPLRSIVGLTRGGIETTNKAKTILTILPKAGYELICDATESELIKYASTAIVYSQILVMNLLYEAACNSGGRWSVIKEAIAADPKLGPGQLDPLHKGGHGAGGDCLLKDFAALRHYYEHMFGSSRGTALLKAMEDKNIELLLSSHKDASQVQTVYG
jgi:UDP-glucose 6-dehydrogenase